MSEPITKPRVSAAAKIVLVLAAAAMLLAVFAQAAPGSKFFFPLVSLWCNLALFACVLLVLRVAGIKFDLFHKAVLIGLWAAALVYFFWALGCRSFVYIWDYVNYINKQYWAEAAFLQGPAAGFQFIFGSFAEDAPENIVVIDTVSKRFSACGARIGCLISKNKEFMNHAMKYCQARLSVATLDQIASAALYTVGPEYFAAVREEYKKRRDTLCRKLREIPGVVFDVPGGAFYVMAALPVDDADKFQTWLLEEFDDAGETVMFAPGASMYRTPGKGKNEVRMAYVIESHKIERAMDILKKAIEVYNNR